MPYFTSDGTNIHVEMSGSGTPLVMLHELALDLRQWTPQKEVLRGNHQVFRLDFRGHGRSARAASGHSWNGWTTDVLRGLVQFGIDRHRPGTLIAHGYACEVALRVALAEPRRVTSLLLVAPMVWGASVSAEWQELLQSMRRAVSADDFDGAMALLRSDVSYAGVCRDPQLERAVREMQQGFSGDFLLAEEPDEGAPTLERLRECPAPTLVVQAALDRRDFNETAETLVERLPAARLVTFEKAAHFPNLENPEAFNRIVLDWLLEHERSD